MDPQRQPNPKIPEDLENNESSGAPPGSLSTGALPEIQKDEVSQQEDFSGILCGNLPSLTEGIEVEIKFNPSEKLHEFPVNVEKNFSILESIARKTLELQFKEKLLSIQKLKIEELSSAHMGRVFKVDALSQHNESGQVKEEISFIIKASLDELNGKGGDLYAQYNVQELCNAYGIRTPKVLFPPRKDGEIVFMAEEYIEGTPASKFTFEKLHEIGFYEKIGEYLGRVHLLSDPRDPSVTAEFLSRAFFENMADVYKRNFYIPTNYLKPRSRSEKRLIHCDCHLGNILIDEKGEVVVIDWGAAKFDSPLEELQYFLIGAKKDTDNVHNLSYFTEDDAEKLSVPFGGRYVVIPKKYREDFVKGYTSVNNEIIKSVEDLENPIFELKLLWYKSISLIDHANWMKDFKSERSNGYRRLCIVALRETIQGIAEVAQKFSGVDPRIIREVKNALSIVSKEQNIELRDISQIVEDPHNFPFLAINEREMDLNLKVLEMLKQYLPKFPGWSFNEKMKEIDNS